MKSLERALRRLRVVRLGTVEAQTARHSGSMPFGVPVSLSAELVVLQFLRDFRLDGYVAVPTSQISEVRLSPFERTYTRICSSQRILARLKSPPGLDATSLLHLLADLHRSRRLVLVTESDRVSIGRTRSISDTAVTLEPFDATGRWLPPVSIALGDVLDVQWSSRYLKVWKRHLG